MTKPKLRAIGLLVCALMVACSTPAAPTEPVRARLPTLNPTPTHAPAAVPAPSATPRAAPEARLTRYHTDRAAHPLAVCNDGSTPAFYLARGAGDAERRWMILFEGDGFCTDAASCKARNRDETSSTTTPPWTDAAGIASADAAQNPDFWNWNRAVLIYCTSDLWTGTRYEADADSGFYFRGHYVVNAFIGALMDERIVGAPSLRAATQVLLAGTGAGGEGLLHNVNRLAHQLAPAATRAVVDGATAPWVSPFLQQEREERQIAALRRWVPRLDESCTAVNTFRDINCLEADYVVLAGHVLPPLFVRQDQMDAHALIGQLLTGKNEGQKQLMRKFAEGVQDLARRQTGAFTPSSGIGVALTNLEFNRQRVDGLTFAQVLGNWTFDRPGAKQVIALPRLP